MTAVPGGSTDPCSGRASPGLTSRFAPATDSATSDVWARIGHQEDRLFSAPVPSVLFKLSTGDSYSREVESEEAAIKQVKSFFDRHDEYLRDWIRVDGNAWIARSAVVAVEVRKDSEPEAAIG